MGRSRILCPHGVLGKASCTLCRAVYQKAYQRSYRQRPHALAAKCGAVGLGASGPSAAQAGASIPKRRAVAAPATSADVRALLGDEDFLSRLVHPPPRFGYVPRAKGMR